MPTRVKKDKPNPKKTIGDNKSNFFSQLDKFLSYFSLKHLDKVVDKKDLPQIIALIFIFFMFYKAFPLIENSNDYFFGVPSWLFVVTLFLIVLIIIILLFRKKSS